MLQWIIASNTKTILFTWRKIEITAIDSSGFVSGYCSYYYSWRTGKKRRSFLKTSISVDTGKFIIASFKISGKPVHDAKHAMP
jgi:hypothetical protein